MNYNEFKAKIFAERPEVKEEYDALGPQYEIIRAEIESRKAAGITQKELAEKSGINIRQIQKYESGEYDTGNMTLKNAVSLARALECRAEDLL